MAKESEGFSLDYFQVMVISISVTLFMFIVFFIALKTKQFGALLLLLAFIVGIVFIIFGTMVLI